MALKKICGIYKITSPSGRIYIGQSVDIRARFLKYKKCNAQSQRLLHKSLVKYGADNHNYDILHELPIDIEEPDLTRYEQLYMDQYRACGFKMLNICLYARSMKGVNYGKKKSQECIEKIASKNRGRISPLRGKKHTDETREKIKAKRKEQIMPKGVQRRKSIAFHGRTPSEETRLKMSLAKKGKKWDTELVLRRTKIQNQKRLVKKMVSGNLIQLNMF